MRIDIRPAAANQLSNLKAVSQFKFISLSWTLPVGDPSYKAAQIWVNTINDRETATLFDTVAGNMTTYPVNDTNTRYFWIRSVNEYGRADGPFTGPASGSSTQIDGNDLKDGALDLTSAKITGQLASGKVSGLGALAILDTVGVAKITGLGALATQSSVNGATQVTNLGDLAYADSIAANQIGAGTLAAGVIYAGTISANQINAGTMTADRINGGTISGSTININGNFRVYSDGTSQLYTANLTRCSLSNGDASGLDAVTANTYGTGAAIKCNGNIIPGGGGSLGNASNSWSNIYSATAVTVTSDARTKKDISDSDLGLDFIMKLRPVSYRMVNSGMKIKELRELHGPFLSGKPEYEAIYEATPGVRIHYGFLAQDVKKALGNRDAAMWVLSDKDDPDSPQALRYEELIPVMVRAMQEMQDEIKELKAKLAK